ncbi:uncharacterized protein LOC144110991 isoform X5 [Amblyomma americanum]
MEESPVPNAVASRPLCRVKECPGAQVLLSDMWFGGCIRCSEILATLVQQLRRTDAACGLRHIVFPLQPRSVESFHCRISQLQLGHHPSLRFRYYGAMPAR